MTRSINILLQTTIPTTDDDWHIRRFSLLANYLASLIDEAGHPLLRVTARDRAPMGAEDPVLSVLDRSDVDELWLFAVDTGDGLTAADSQGIVRFHQRGGGLLVARDHEDLGCSVCALGEVGRAHFFHTRHVDPDAARRVPDDHTASISWPNYHSGRNGDYQAIRPVEPVHELLLRPTSASGIIERFPAHPHEGAVGVPSGEPHARVIATGQSAVSGRPFNLAVAFERVKDEHGTQRGRAVAESSFHHFADYNWDPAIGCPSFVEDLPGDGVRHDPSGLADIKAYVENLARWLVPKPVQ